MENTKPPGSFIESSTVKILIVTVGVVMGVAIIASCACCYFKHKKKRLQGRCNSCSQGTRKLLDQSASQTEMSVTESSSTDGTSADETQKGQEPIPFDETVDKEHGNSASGAGSGLESIQFSRQTLDSYRMNLMSYSISTPTPTAHHRIELPQVSYRLDVLQIPVSQENAQPIGMRQSGSQLEEVIVSTSTEIPTQTNRLTGATASIAMSPKSRMPRSMRRSKTVSFGQVNYESYQDRSQPNLYLPNSQSESSSSSSSFFESSNRRYNGVYRNIPDGGFDHLLHLSQETQHSEPNQSRKTAHTSGYGSTMPGNSDIEIHKTHKGSVPIAPQIFKNHTAPKESIPIASQIFKNHTAPKESVPIASQIFTNHKSLEELMSIASHRITENQLTPNELTLSLTEAEAPQAVHPEEDHSLNMNQTHMKEVWDPNCLTDESIDSITQLKYSHMNIHMPVSKESSVSDTENSHSKSWKWRDLPGTLEANFHNRQSSLCKDNIYNKIPTESGTQVSACQSFDSSLSESISHDTQFGDIAESIQPGNTAIVPQPGEILTIDYNSTGSSVQSGSVGVLSFDSNYGSNLEIERQEFNWTANIRKMDCMNHLSHAVDDVLNDHQSHSMAVDYVAEYQPKRGLAIRIDPLVQISSEIELIEDDPKIDSLEDKSQPFESKQRTMTQPVHAVIAVKTESSIQQGVPICDTVDSLDIRLDGNNDPRIMEHDWHGDKERHLTNDYITSQAIAANEENLTTEGTNEGSHLNSGPSNLGIRTRTKRLENDSSSSSSGMSSRMSGSTRSSPVISLSLHSSVPSQVPLSLENEPPIPQYNHHRHNRNIQQFLEEVKGFSRVLHAELMEGNLIVATERSSPEQLDHLKNAIRGIMPEDLSTYRDRINIMNGSALGVEYAY